MGRRLVAIALIGPALAACSSDGPTCSGAFVTQRSPVTLACVLRQVASADCPDIAPAPPWPPCRHPCEAIRDEAACIAAPGCRVTRELCDVTDDRCAVRGPFIGCFPLDTDAIAAGPCAGLGAGACATRDDCGAQYLLGPDCPAPTGTDAGASARLPPDGLDCTFAFVTCFDERAPPP